MLKRLRLPLAAALLALAAPARSDSAGAQAAGTIPTKDKQPYGPPDRPVSFTDRSAWIAMFEPCRVEAQRTFPDARARFEAGLPARHTFFVTVRLVDSVGGFEQAFIRLKAFRGDSLDGWVASTINTVRGYRDGQPIVLPVSDVIDWTIARPDGTEEGNLMGNFLDWYQDNGRPAGALCRRIAPPG